MNTLDSLKIDKTQYDNLKILLQNISRLLLTSKNSLEIPAGVGKYYRIDGKSIDSDEIKANYNKIDGYYKLLVNTILPELDVQIESTKRAIVAEELRLERERQERQRREEETKRREQAEREAELKSKSAINAITKTPTLVSKKSIPSKKFK